MTTKCLLIRWLGLLGCFFPLLSFASTPIHESDQTTTPRPQQADAQQQQGALPLWELGVGGALLYLPHYPGSDQARWRTLPFPALVYRGERLQADGGGVRGLLLNSERWKVDFSAAGSLPVDSEENDARAGLPDLDFGFELGPQLSYRVMDAKPWQLWFRLPVRAAFSTDFSNLDFRGWVVSPQAHVSSEQGRWLLRATVAPRWTSAKYQNYYYGVAPEFATANRAAFESDSGYAGTIGSLSASYRWGRWTVGGFAAYFNLHNTRFGDSPLLRRKDSAYVGLRISYRFLESSQRVSRRTEEE